MSDAENHLQRRSEGQTFLVGPSLYLRGVAREDAASAPAWYPHPFPLPPNLVDERLTEEIPGNESGSTYRLIACRRADDHPVGSVAFHLRDWSGADCGVAINPVYSDELRAAIIAELIALIVPYLLIEREQIIVRLTTEAGHPLIDRAAAAQGMRRGYRLREALFRNGTRRDLLGYEIFHPRWVARLGLPPVGDEGSIAREVRAPAPRTFAADGADLPPNAMMVGERLFLRPLTPEDAIPYAHWSLREPDQTIAAGRPVYGPLGVEGFHRNQAKTEPPTWVRFAVCLRESGEIIGANGLNGLNLVHRTAETESEIFRPDYRDQGFGTEAKHLLLAYAFDRLGLHMIRSYIWQYNARSIAAVRKQGYRDAGTISWIGLKHGELANAVIFDLLASEWQVARR